MARSHSFAWILVSLLSLALSAPLQAGITPSGDVDPILPDYLWWWTGGGDSWTDAYIGKTVAGSVTVNHDSDLRSYYGHIGHESGATGVVTVDGSGSTWTNSDNLCVGRDGQGTLHIINGGAVSNDRGYIGLHSGFTSVVTVDGSSSTWTNSDYLSVSYGTLDITNDGAVSNSDGYIGNEAGSTSVVTVDGSGSTWTCGSSLYVGNYGHGTLDITDDGAVSNSNGYIGTWSDSTGVVTVDGSGSTWTNSIDLYVGCSGQGTLNITNGGTVSNDDEGYIGYEAGSTGNVTVDGIGSTWKSSSDISVGYSGQGTLNITNGGAVSNTYGDIGYCSGSKGEVTVDGAGSTWTNSIDLYIGCSGQGTLNITNGGAVEVGGTLKVWGAGTLNVGATGTVNIGDALVLAQDSTLTTEPGAVIHITGSAFQNESTNADNLAGLRNLTLIFEGGTGDVDPFEVAGEDIEPVIGGYHDNFALGRLQLGGADIGEIQLVDAFDNDGLADSEALYVQDLRLGDGSVLDLAGLNLYYLTATIDPAGIVLNGSITQVPATAGDANLDGQVVDSDLSLLLSNWNQAGLWTEGNFNGDGTVTDADLSLLLSNWGAGAGGSGSDVPEPAALGLLVLGGLAVLKRRRRV